MNDDISVTTADLEKAYKLDTQIKRLTKEYDELKVKLRTGLDAGQKYAAPGYELTLSAGSASVPVKVFDQFKKTFPVRENPSLYRQTLVPVSELRKYLDADQLEPFLSYAQPSVSIKKTE